MYSGWWSFGKKNGKGTYVYAATNQRVKDDLQPVMFRDNWKKRHEILLFFVEIRLKALGRRINALREDGFYLMATTLRASLRITSHLVLVSGISRMEMFSMEISSKMLSKMKW